MLLPIIADALARQKYGSFSDSASREATILFRNVWFLCVLYGFADHESWPLEWYSAVETIASHTPVLISPVKNYIESDLELNSVLRQINAERVSFSSILDIIGTFGGYTNASIGREQAQTKIGTSLSFESRRNSKFFLLSIHLCSLCVLSGNAEGQTTEYCRNISLLVGWSPTTQFHVYHAGSHR